ncbi:MAG TPA: hypothetical protein VK139_02065 [Microbacteriaceae bacterium]|nr:hypothetical protein [Microbacteriaceae bacterium]
MTSEPNSLKLWATTLAATATAIAGTTFAVAAYLGARTDALDATKHTVAVLDAQQADLTDVVLQAQRTQLAAAQAHREIGAAVADPATATGFDSARSDVDSHISILLVQRAAVAARAHNLPEQVSARLLWPPVAEAFARNQAIPLAHSGIGTALAALAKSQKVFTTSHASWQAAETARLAEEARAQAAKAASATARSGNPVNAQAEIESIILSLEPRASISWDDGLCSGNHVCGRTVIGNGNPVVHLDRAVMGRYLGYSGRYVLVHEAAHARSWFLYGSVDRLYAESTALMTNGREGSAAAEYMADCATIVKIGYSVGTYTSSCAPNQLAEAARYW